MESGPDVHAALCALSAQGALFYSDCMGDATPSGLKEVRDGTGFHTTTPKHTANLRCIP